jgi:hypothetical protein|tara:strand:- start:961 stop:1338 length:378 start_codon:yes stop_codon:yes gene_type:complete
MAHYAFLNQENIVSEVITGKDESEKIQGLSPEEYYGNFRGQVCKRTSYNTYAGVHVFGETPFRKNFAGIGYTYDADRDAFIPPKPFASWVLDEDSCLWKAPIPRPDDGNQYVWNEETQAWDQIDD